LRVSFLTLVDGFRNGSHGGLIVGLREYPGVAAIWRRGNELVKDAASRQQQESAQEEEGNNLGGEESGKRKGDSGSQWELSQAWAEGVRIMGVRR